MAAGVIRMGTRSSALARAQTAIVAAALIEANPDLEIEIFPQLASTVFKDDILNRFADNAGAKQPETDFAARTG